MTNVKNVQYWATKLQENNEEINPLIRKMYDKLDSLSYEELFSMRRLLEQNRSFVSLLNEELALPDPAPRKKFRFWKK